MPYKRAEDRRKHDNEKRSQLRKEYFKDKFCFNCGSIENLVLHHVDPKTKSDSWIWLWGKEKREQEIAKCIVLCVSCHTAYHNRIRKPKPIQHGTLSSYFRHKCRCMNCKKFASEYMKKGRMFKSVTDN